MEELSMVLGYKIIIRDIVSGVLSGFLLTLLLLLFTLFFLYNYLNYSFEKKNIEKIEKKEFLESFIEKFITDKLELKIFDEKQNEQNIVGKSNKNIDSLTDPFINSVKDLEDVNEKEVMYIESKNYGKNDIYSIRTWYGINYTKLKDPTSFKYICFKIKGENKKIYLDKNDILEWIDKVMNDEEKAKYVKRNSFDTYLMKSLEDNNFYITRLGVHLENPIKIKGV